MKKKIIFTYLIVFAALFTFAQKQATEHPALTIYKLLSNESINLKDSLAIYALNFELRIVKKKEGTQVVSIAANDSLAFSLFPSYKKFYDIDFSSLMGEKNKFRLIIPILIYGSSPEKMIYKDKNGNPLISLNAAINAAYALYRPAPYNNVKDSGMLPGHLRFKDAKNNRLNPSFWEAITMEPFSIVINNIQ
jgi:hypothetical protein